MTRRLALLGLLALALGAGVAYAASLTVSTARMTAFARCALWNSTYDAEVDEANPNSNFASSTDLNVRSRSGGQDRRSFVYFSGAGCVFPPGAQVVSATVSLFLLNAPNANRTYEIRPVSAGWTEAGVTWNTQPAVGAVTDAIATGTTDNVWLTWDVTADVQAMFAGSLANNGWRISDSAENSFTAYQGFFGSQENGTATRRPRATILYYP